jgi:hypothetical protein
VQGNVSIVSCYCDSRAPRLADIQKLLYRLITAPGGVEEALTRTNALSGDELGTLIAGADRLAPLQRVEIYANAYFYRLLDVLKEDFRCTYAVCGDIGFHNLITGYLLEYPPTESSIFYAGHLLPAYLRKIGRRPSSLLPQLPFLADLAQLEIASIEVFHGADAEALQGTSLERLATEAWPALEVRLHPATQIIEVEWRVDKVMVAIKEGRQWVPPEHIATGILVWRNESLVHYRVVEPGERAALILAARGTDFASICTVIADNLASAVSATDLPAIINRMLVRWLHEGVLINAKA